MRWASPWVTYLAANALPGNGLELPGEYIDAIPANLLLDESGNWVYIDAEWSVDGPIPIKWVLIRGLIYAFSSSPMSPALAGVIYRDLVKEVLALLGYELTAEDIKSAVNLEDKLQRTVFGSRWKGPRNMDLLSSPIRSFAYTTLQDELARVKSTISWQITKPLRFIAFILRWITEKRSR